MILQLLVKYYDRLKDDPEADIPQFGYSNEKVSFSLVIDEKGNLLQVKDIRVKPEKGKAKPALISVPKMKGRSGKNPPPYFLWDNAKYIFGVEKNKVKDSEEILIESIDRFTAFKSFHEAIESDDVGYQAVLKFLSRWNASEFLSISNHEDILNDTGNLVFELDSAIGYLHDRPAVRQLWQDLNLKEDDSGTEALCLLTGENTSIASTHPLIKGVYGGQAAGAAIISFNKSSFVSFQKKQNLNSPIGEKAAFSYTAALNYLLDGTNNQRLQLADTSTVFWAENKTPMESFFGQMLDQKDDGFSEELSDFLQSVKQGQLPKSLDGDCQFYVLGLAPNAARISIRFWQVATVKEMADKIGQHFRDFEIIKSHEKNPTFPGMWKLLIETAVLHKSENIQPLLGGALMRAIISGSTYPEMILTKIITRIRADQNVNYIRAGLLKAILNRKLRTRNLTQNYKEITVALDPENKDSAYLHGRLFAILERAQQDAIPGANSTIKDRFFGSASSTPKIVFPVLIRGAQNHFQKVKRKFYTEKMMAEILENIQEFPAHFSLDQQGQFAIGYYHQRQDFFKKKTKTEAGE